MKPTKNRYYCRDIGRTKMLFDTEEQAQNFIKYNNDDILSDSGHAPTRAYYCVVCGGWHVTSLEKFEGDSLSERLMKAYPSADQEMSTSDKIIAIMEKNLKVINDAIDNKEDELAVRSRIFSALEYLRLNIGEITDEYKKQEILNKLSDCTDRIDSARILLDRAEKKLDAVNRYLSEDKIRPAELKFSEAKEIITTVIVSPEKEERKKLLLEKLEDCQNKISDYYYKSIIDKYQN